METIHDNESILPQFDSPSNLFILMEIFEEFIHLCYINDISFWIDWGTALGAIRHSNIIPWDIDCDLCFTKDNYEKLLILFEKSNNIIGNLICYPNGYNDRYGCIWIQNKKYLHLGTEIFGIDCVSYEIGENITKTLMAQTIIDAYPVIPASYDFLNNELFPLKSIPFLGNYVLTPNKILDKMKLAYGEENYLKYPNNEYQEWFKNNSNKLFLLNSPFQIVPEVFNLINGLNLNSPFIIRNSNEFNINIDELKNLFINEYKILSWYETKNDLFNEKINYNAKDIIKQWENNQLKTNIIDSPCIHNEFLPNILYERINNLDESIRHQALCYILTNKNTLTKFHCDHGGGGWVYLKQGKKLWWFISPDCENILKENNYSLENLRDLSFTELVFLNNYFLWGKIYIILQESNDFIYFPENWAHRVFTYDRAFGIGGYVK